MFRNSWFITLHVRSHVVWTLLLLPLTHSLLPSSPMAAMAMLPWPPLPSQPPISPKTPVFFIFLPCSSAFSVQKFAAFECSSAVRAFFSHPFLLCHQSQPMPWAALQRGTSFQWKYGFFTNGFHAGNLKVGDLEVVFCAKSSFLFTCL